MTDRECKVNPVSSRVCEKGTKSCTVYHNDRNQLCREFTELTGGHWHEWTEYQGNKCKCGLFRYRGTDNPTYDNPADVLRVMMVRKDLDKFARANKFKAYLIVANPDKTSSTKYAIQVESIIEPDALLKAAVAFLKEGKK